MSSRLKAVFSTRPEHTLQHTLRHPRRPERGSRPRPHLHPSHPLEPCDGVADGVHAHVAHVQLAGRVGEHGEHVKLGLRPLGKNDRKRQGAYLLSIYWDPPARSSGRLPEGKHREKCPFEKTIPTL